MRLFDPKTWCDVASWFVARFACTCSRDAHVPWAVTASNPWMTHDRYHSNIRQRIAQIDIPIIPKNMCWARFACSYSRDAHVPWAVTASNPSMTHDRYHSNIRKRIVQIDIPIIPKNLWWATQLRQYKEHLAEIFYLNLETRCL